MNLADMKPGDVLVSTDERGTGFYRVEKVCRRMVKVMTEQGHMIRAYPANFDRKLSAERASEARAQGIRI